MDNKLLINYLKKRERFSKSKFLSTLNKRKFEEIEHSDIIHAPTEKTGVSEDTVKQHAKSRPVYETNSAVRNYINSWLMRNVKEKVVLDLACGSGEITKQIHKFGAKISIGTDLAPITIENNKSHRTSAQKNIFFILDDAEKMTIPNDTIDIVICSGMLHHVVLEKAISEINRVLKPGGQVFAIEALKHNPIFNLYRKMTPGARTHWESAHILGIQEAKIINKIIPVKKIKYWQLFSILAIFFPKKIRGITLLFLNYIDRIILSIPYINRMAWIFTIELEKPK